jgi:hypothetical protein
LFARTAFKSGTICEGNFEELGQRGLTIPASTWCTRFERQFGMVDADGELRHSGI